MANADAAGDGAGADGGGDGGRVELTVLQQRKTTMPAAGKEKDVSFPDQKTDSDGEPDAASDAECGVNAESYHPDDLRAKNYFGELAPISRITLYATSTDGPPSPVAPLPRSA